MKRQHLSNSDIKLLNEQLSSFSLVLNRKDSAVKIEAEPPLLLVNNKLCFFFLGENPVPTLKYILESKLYETENFRKAIVDMGAVKFVVSGADIMRPGIREIDESIAKDDIVLVLDEKNHKPLALTKALFSGKEIKALEKGKVLKNIHWVADKIWNYS